MAAVHSCMFLILYFLGSCYTANILFAIPFTSPSHYFMLRPIGLELARRGHNVTVITGIKEKDPPNNYHQIMVNDVTIWDVVKGGRPNVFTMANLTNVQFHEQILWGANLAFMEVALNTTKFQRFLASDENFDLVISEQFFQEAVYILAHKYNAKLVLVTTTGNCMRHNIVTRNPLQLATIPQEIMYVKEPTSFWGRLKILYFTTYEFICWKFWYLEKQEELVKKYIKNLTEPVPSLYEMQQKASLMFVNRHFSFETPMAYLPNIVEIGGLHLSANNKELPADLKSLLDQSTNGVVYMNFGSNVKSSELPADKKNAFLNVFRKLNHTVLWKWEDETLENKPKNLETRKWLPQNDILAHPNIRVFISHGGLIGMQEAIYNGIPIIGVPIYGDQYNNVLEAADRGFGKLLMFHDINEENLESVLMEVLNNDSYKKRAIEISKRFKDRPMSPLDTAMFWIEYILRNNNAEAIKNPAMELNWFAYLMVDVYTFIIFILLLFIYIIVKVSYIIKHLLVKLNSTGKKYLKLD